MIEQESDGDDGPRVNLIGSTMGSGFFVALKTKLPVNKRRKERSTNYVTMDEYTPHNKGLLGKRSRV